MRSTAISVVFMALLGSAMAYPAPQKRVVRTKTVTKTVTSTKVVFEDITITPTAKSTPPPAPVQTSTSIVIVEPKIEPVLKPEAVPEPKTTVQPQPTPTPTPPPAPVRKPIENVVEDKEEEEETVVVKPPVEETNNGGSSGGSGFQAEILSLHNSARAKYGNAPALSWDSTIAAFAQSRANTCVMKHDAQGHGENLAAGSGPDWIDEKLSAKRTVFMWVDEEVVRYNFASGSSSGVTGHFTQVVWKGSTKLGCAYKDCNNPNVDKGVVGRMVVCNYDPPGNYGGQYQKNVSA